MACLLDEPGAEVVDGVLEDLQALGLKVEAFLPADGELAGRLWEPTRQVGLSLGDRAWAALSLDVAIQVVR